MYLVDGKGIWNECWMCVGGRYCFCVLLVLIVVLVELRQCLCRMFHWRR